VTLQKGEIIACSLTVDKYIITCVENGKVQVNQKEKLEGTKINVVAQKILDNNTTYGNYTYMGGTYLKGINDSNYVWYNGFLWRIMGINENGTIRLITEKSVGSVAGGPGYNVEVLSYDKRDGYINEWLNEYFMSNLDSSKTDIITKSEWCINSTTDGSSKRETCDGGSIFEANIGMITLDEYNLSGANAGNYNYYLVDSENYRTLTPNSDIHVYRVSSSGNVTTEYDPNMIGVRPVINVSADAIITGGNGSLSDAYILNQTSEAKTGNLNEKVTSGEYVSLDGKIYRVVTKEANGTKLIYNGYYEEPAETLYETSFGDNNTFTVESGIGQILNNDVLEWLGNSEKIIKSNWYQTSGINSGAKYITILNDKINPVEAKVGLIRVGEILPELLEGNATYWSLTKYDANAVMSRIVAGDGNEIEYNSGIWTLNNCSAYYVNVPDEYSIPKRNIRPVIVVDKDTKITSGNGTLKNPYIIE